MVVKVLAFWDVPLGKEEGYAKFFAETAPSIMKGLEKLGLRIVGKWEAIIGSGPTIVYEYEFDDFKALARFLRAKNTLRCVGRWLLTVPTLAIKFSYPLINFKVNWKPKAMG